MSAAPEPPEHAGPPPLALSAPVAPRRPTVLESHGDRRIDDWYWLRNREDPEVRALLEAENRFTEGQCAHLAGLREELFEEIRSRIAETDLSVPVRKDEWWYYTRTIEGLDYAIHCRLPLLGVGRDPSSPPLVEPGEGARWPDEQLLLDENQCAADHRYFALANFEVSPAHNLLAYAADYSGDERFTLHFRDLQTGRDLDDLIEETSYGVAWSKDGRSVFYTRPDAANRPYQTWRHELGTAVAGDTLVHDEPDERFHVGVEQTKDGLYVLIDLRSKVTSEVLAIRADAPDDEPLSIAGRNQGIEYSVEHHSGTFVLVTNDSAPNFRVVAQPATWLGRSNVREAWIELVPESPQVRIERIDVFARYVAIYERRDGMPRIRVVALPGRAFSGPLPDGEVVPCPELPSSSWGGSNPEFESATLRYGYSSLVTPTSVYDLDMTTNTANLRKRQPVLGDFDPSRFATERLWATSSDGTKVPISVVYRKDPPRGPTNPCLLYGYGSYEASIDPVFSSIRLSLLERGFVFAVAHVRGGGEMGRGWYEDGKLLRKHHTFEDFVSCASYLIEHRFTCADRLVARGGSAGGLLMGAVANMAPELFRAIIAEVPFVDCLTTILDESLPLTVIEWEEWGNPVEDRAVYDAMKRYTPYDNVKAQRYPDLFVTAGLEDPRVSYFEPVKWVQRIRAADPRARVLLKVEMEAGHGGPSGRYQSWREEAYVLSFILDAVGLSG